MTFPAPPPLPPDGNSDALVRAVRSHRISLGLIVYLIGQTIALVIWLTTLRGDVDVLKREYAEMHLKIGTMDTAGTRALDIIRARQTDVIATNSAQDARMREIENKLGDLQKLTIENRFWIEQVKQLLNTYAHPPLRTPPP